MRVISADGEQIGVLSLYEAIKKAQEAGLDLVEIAPNVVPPVCKIIDHGKFRYDQTKRERESKKSQHQIKVKEVKLKPNIDEHDIETKKRHARDFLTKGNKVKVTCTFRGREMVHSEIGEQLVANFCEDLSDISDVETPAKRLGRTINVILAPGAKKKKITATPASGGPTGVPLEAK